jgi:hypothetical protein
MYRLFALAIPVVVAAWVVTPATVIATPSFLALGALLTALALIVTITYKNVQPAASLAQALHDADCAGPGPTQRREKEAPGNSLIRSAVLSAGSRTQRIP